MRLFTTILAAAICAGCSTSPTAVTEMTRPASGVQWTDAKGDDTGELVVVRDKGFRGFAATLRLVVDGEKVCTLENGEGVKLRAPVGMTTVTIRPDKDDFVQHMKPVSINVKVRPNARTVVRTGFQDPGPLAANAISVWIEE